MEKEKVSIGKKKVKIKIVKQKYANDSWKMSWMQTNKTIKEDENENNGSLMKMWS